MVPASVFYLDRVFPHKRRHLVALVLNVLLALLGAALAVLFYYDVSDIIFKRVLGAGAIVLFFRMLFFMAEMYYRSFYFNFPAGQFEFYRLQSTLTRTKRDPLSVFADSRAGARILARVGVSEEEMQPVLEDARRAGRAWDIEFATATPTLSAWAEALCREFETFARLLFKHSVQVKDMAHVARWHERNLDMARLREWWWRAERLKAMPGLGREWAYPQTWTLDRYAHDLVGDRSVYKPRMLMTRLRETEEIESVIARAKQANVMLVGPPGVGKRETVKNLAFRIAVGDINPALRYRRVMLMNPLSLVSHAKGKQAFEQIFMKVMSEAVGAGNVVLVMEDFPEFVVSARNVGSDVPALIEPFLGTDTPVVALADDYQYAQVIQPEHDLVTFFERINIEEPDGETVLRILEEEAELFEMRNGLFFTYAAIKKVAESARRYFSEAVMPAKALGVLEESASWALREHQPYIGEGEVQQLIREMTSIPTGEITDEEKEKLMHLEDILHRRVVSQDEAIDTVADALRRSRADIENTERPMGSLLFLGPTGVGKTETAKTLADAFFGGEEHLLRLDMSEYSGAGGLAKLIGSFETGRAGVLSNLLRAHPYGVLLLDEFEKAADDVHNLFLQILDEGFFSDMNGRRINARNIIFIATSNAGSGLIYEAVGRGDKLANAKNAIVDRLIKERIFRPELVNRFDAVVLFHPLGDEHVRKVAFSLLQRLANRLLEKNYHLVITEPLVDVVVREGYDERFGAREMRRAIQDKIEKIIAKKVIAGEIKPGDDVILTEADLAFEKLGVE